MNTINPKIDGLSKMINPSGLSGSPMSNPLDSIEIMEEISPREGLVKSISIQNVN